MTAGGFSWEPTWKATPNDDRIFEGRGLDLPKSLRRAVPNIFSSFKYEIAAFAENVNKIHSLQDGVFSPGILFVKRRFYRQSPPRILIYGLVGWRQLSKEQVKGGSLQ